MLGFLMRRRVFTAACVEVGGMFDLPQLGVRVDLARLASARQEAVEYQFPRGARRIECGGPQVATK
jgi:hypothetical protein